MADGSAKDYAAHIATQLHPHIEFLRGRWQEFCEMVEMNAEQMAHCQEEQRGKYYRMIEKHPADLEGNKLAEARIDEENKRLQAQGWNLWKFMYEYNYLKLPYISTSFYAPPEVVNPGLWIIENDNGAVNTNQREPKPEESLLCDYAILCYTHDHNVSKGEPRIYFQGTYAGKYFDCDKFYYGSVEHQWSDDRLQRAYNRVKLDLDAWLAQTKKDAKKQRRSRIEKVAAIMAYMKNHPDDDSVDVGKATGIDPSDIRHLWGPTKKALRQKKRNRPHGKKTDGITDGVDESTSCGICGIPLSGTFECQVCKEVVTGECRTCHFTNTHPDRAVP